MILKLYRDNTGCWSFNYKQQHYLVLNIDWVLDKICNLLDKNVLYITLSFKETSDYFAFISDWGTDDINKVEAILGHCVRGIVNIISNPEERKQVIANVFPKIKEHDYIFITDLR